MLCWVIKELSLQALDGFSLCLSQIAEAHTALKDINVFPLLHRLSKEPNQLLRRSIITAVGALSHPGTPYQASTSIFSPGSRPKHRCLSTNPYQIHSTSQGWSCMAAVSLKLLACCLYVWQQAPDTTGFRKMFVHGGVSSSKLCNAHNHLSTLQRIWMKRRDKCGQSRFCSGCAAQIPALTYALLAAKH